MTSCAPPLHLSSGIGTRNARSTMIKGSTVFALHCFVLPCVPIKMQRVGLLDFTLGYSSIVYLTFLFHTASCPFLTYNRPSRKMFNNCVCGARGKLPVASLGTGSQQAFAAISVNNTTAYIGCFKLAVSNTAVLQSLCAATLAPQPTAAAPTTAATKPTRQMRSIQDSGFTSLDRQGFCTGKLASTAARTIDRRFVSKPGHDRRYDCAHEFIV